MKSYTDLEQSKKLAEILPHETADMHYSKDFGGSWFVGLAEYTSVKIPKYVGNIEEHLLPCWSLAALISVLPRSIEYKGDTYYLGLLKEYVEYANNKTSFTGILFLHTTGNDNLINACYEMILKLHERKLL